MEKNILGEEELGKLKDISPKEKYELFREKYSEFIYEDFKIEETDENIKLKFFFRVPGLSGFTPVWTVPKPENTEFSLTDGILKRLVFSLGLVELCSYWKIACPPVVKIRCGKISDSQARWWKRQYFLGLGEFFYRNGIDTDINDFMDIESEGEDFSVPADESGSKLKSSEKRGCLIPVGGGKDSIVTMTILSNLKDESLCYVMNGRGATTASALGAGYEEKDIIGIHRTLDKNMLELNSLGYLNGHTPFSALVAFSGVLIAEMYGKESVVLSNESSANESTVAGKDVNHQYSKSYRFESDFASYVSEYIGSDVKYFSLLRPWSEFQIAAYFSGLKKFHPVFRSCNVGSKTDSWCGKCAKCLFVALLLTPFLPDQEINEIFGRDILDDETLIPLMRELCGETPEKPFECVGSRDEISAAMAIGISVREREGKVLPAVLKGFKETGAYAVLSKEGALNAAHRYFSYYQEENLLPSEFDKLMKSETGKLKESHKSLTEISG